MEGSALPDQPSRTWRVVRLLAGLLLLGIVIAGAATSARKQSVGTDFHVFWRGGYNFAHGLPLYLADPGARHFNYPPFAAQLFQVLGIFPLQTAAFLFYVASAGMLVLAVRLTQQIVQQLQPTWRHGKLPLFLAVLCSAVFVLENLVHVQVNILTFFLCLLGVKALVEKRELTAGGWLVAATAIKVTPIFFPIWAVLRGNRRTVMAVAVFGALVLILPIAQRGVPLGVNDLTEYYRTVLHQFVNGAVVPNYRNQNLAGMVFRAFTPRVSDDVPPYDYAYLSSYAGAAPLVYKGAALLILATFLGFMFRYRVRRRPIGALEICSVFLASHLLSGITWKAHLVSLLFTSYVFFAMDLSVLKSWRRWPVWTAWGGVIVIGMGRDVVGTRAHHYMAGYSVYVWVMLGLLTLSLIWGDNSVSGKSERER